MSSINEIWSAFGPLWDDIKQEAHFPQKRPLLAHYTSLQTLESIIGNGEIWFSNPLLMNDFEEVRFGMINGRDEVLSNIMIKEAFETEVRYNNFLQQFNARFKNFDEKEAIDLYVFCLSEHDPSDSDGRLSLWRGYGADGKGAALVIDTNNVPADDKLPLVVAPVQYATAQERLDWINNTLNSFSKIVQATEIPEDKIWLSAHALFERIYLFSVFSKHKSFDEEKEWRLAYIPHRDTVTLVGDQLSYFLGANGLEPKLKLNIEKLGVKLGTPMSIETLVHSIILGPQASSLISRAMMVRMLKELHKESLVQVLRSSSIPYRSLTR